MKTEEVAIHYTAYLDGLSQPVITTDAQGVITSCNRAAESVFERHQDEMLNRNVGEYFLATDSSEKLEHLISNLTNNHNINRQYLLKKAIGPSYAVRISVSGIFQDDTILAGAIVAIKESPEKITRFHQLEIVYQMLSQLGDEYLPNINKITSLCGELLGATCALYNRLDNRLLCSFGKWNTPDDFTPVDKPDGHICYDVIRKAGNEIFYVRNLPATTYAETDPNVKLYNLRTYIGHQVKCNGKPVGSLCIVFQDDYVYTETDRYLLSLLALALEGEETRESLRRSKNKYRELFDFAVEGILISTNEGIVTKSNNSIQHMTGFSDKELFGRHISSVLFTKESLQAEPFKPEKLLQGIEVVKEREIRCKDKKIISVEMHSKMMPDKSFQTVLFNITKKKEAETRLKLSENTYRGIINSVNDAVYVLDRDGYFVDVNEAAEKMYGYEKGYFRYKNPTFLSAPGMNDMEQIMRYIEDAYTGMPIRFEFWGLRSDGSVFPKETSLSPGIWFGKNVVIAVGRDITERKQAEELLKVSEEKYRMLVQYSSDPIFSINRDGTYRFVNESFAALFDKIPDDIIGKTPFDIFPNDAAQERINLVQQVFDTGEKAELEVKNTTSKSDHIYFVTLYDPIKDTLGNVMWVTGISKDITQRKKAEEELRMKNAQLKASNAEKDKFFSIVAHDLRSPMNGFLGLTAIMAEDIGSLSSFDLKEIATTMQTSAVNLYRLIENLLEWSRMQRGIISFEPQPMFLKPLLTKCLELMKDAAGKKEIELSIVSPDYTVVYADLHMLETVIRNLISNAIKFSPDHGKVEVSTSKTDNKMIRIEVKDNGIGMSPDLLSKLFILTENTSRPGTGGEPSTGLGLILCKEFVEKQGGIIWAESKEYDGSSFVFTLPQT